jgi:hypothetical protein
MPKNYVVAEEKRQIRAHSVIGISETKF